jgi:hypothetical protein
VSHIPEKLAGSLARLEREASSGRRVLMAIPAPNAAQLTADRKSELAAGGIEVLELAHVQALWDALAIKLPGGPRKVAARPLVQAFGRSRQRGMWVAGAAAVLLGTAWAAIYLGDRPPPAIAVQGPVPNQTPVPPPPPATPTPPPAQSPAPPAIAERARVAIMDRKLRLEFFAVLNPDCSSRGFTRVRILEQAQHGNIAIDHGSRFSYFEQDHPRVECNKRQTEGTVLSYEPNAGFVGADSVTVEAITPTGFMYKLHYAIDIDPGAAAGSAPLAALIQSAKPVEYTRVAPADQTLLLDFLYYLNPDCMSVGYATVRVIEEPKHGKLSAEQGTGFSYFQQDNVRYECNKRRTDGVHLSYIPEAGFTGPDSLMIAVIYPEGDFHKRHYAIEVK